MSNQPIVMNIMYTPYSLPRNATKQQRMDNARERAFFDMTGDTNIYKYMTTEEKQKGEEEGKKKKFTVYDYFKRTVFNQKGIITDEELAGMKERAKNNKGNIWHGYISLNQEESHKIDTPEKCIELVKKTFPQFFKDAKLKADNIDLMCALHKDRPHITATYYVYYDNVAPTLSVTGASFGSATGTSFTVTSSDASGSTTTLYYKKGNSGSFTKASSTSYTVSSTAGDGTYYFYATDAAGNTSNTYSVTLSTEAVSGEFVKSDTDNTVFFYWGNSSWTATLDGNSYTSGTWITEEGDHTIILTSSTTGSATYPFTIDHYYVAYQVVEATCSSQGYTIYKCSQCGKTYNGDYTDKLEHSYTTSPTAATCTEQGYITYTCVNCGYSYKSDYTAAKGHTYETTVIDATCTEQGYTIYTCIVCGYSYIGDYTETIAHSYQSTYIAPSCTESGYMEYTCVNCGDKYTDEATLPTGHTYTITVIKSATCTETGLRHYCCDVCGYEYDAVIPATGHNYVITDVENNDGNTTRTYECSNCGDSYTEDLGNQTEYVASYVEYLFDGYSNYVWWLLLATAGVWSIVMGVFFAIATKNEDKQKARKMVVNYLIGLVVIAVILVAAPYLAYGIAVLVT